MRKIVIKETREHKEKIKKIIVGVVLISLMVLSTVGYAFFQTIGNNEEIEKIEYKGVEFVLNANGYWYFVVDNVEFATAYNPVETEEITLENNLNLNDFLGNRIHYSYDNNIDGMAEILRNLDRLFQGNQAVCLEECEEDLPVKDCSSNIIIIKEQNQTLIKQEENCIHILAKQEEIIKASDAFIFKILGF